MADKTSDDKGDDDLLRKARTEFQRCADAEEHNRRTYEEDTEFSRKGDQWPSDIAAARDAEGRPHLTINKLPAFIRQVVNDARQNKPSIKVHPVDSGADPKTAEVLNGLIRNIEYTSDADVAYDTAIECAVGGGFGYLRIVTDYAYDDSFDIDLRFERVANPLSVYGDPDSIRADSSDWNVAFVVERVKKEVFEAQYKGKSQVSWDDAAWADCGPDWLNSDGVLVAEWWTREQIDKPIVKLSNGQVRDDSDLDTDDGLKALIATGDIKVVGERTAKCWKVTQRRMTGAEMLSSTEWRGQYIPIVPVYGDEFWIKGKRYLRSLIHSAIDPQRMHNYWRTTATELVALAPRTPYIGEEGSFDADPNWSTANSKSHPFLEYAKGAQIPQRQPLDGGIAAGALQEALNAADDMKSIIGIYDASLGARSNETSGKAIMARQREGDVSTFHFIDNMTRAVRHVGRILIDLIQELYSEERVVRVIGEDGSQRSVPVNQQYPAVDPKTGKPQMQQVTGIGGQPAAGPDGNPLMEAVMAMHDLDAGKYDLTVKAGPSYTTQREETADQMMQLIQAYPEAAPIIGDILVKNLDWQGADEIADRLKALLPPAVNGQPAIPPEVQQKLQQGAELLQQYQQEIQTLRADTSVDKQKADQQFEIGQQKAANDYALGLKKIENDRALAVEKGDAVETTGPDGQKTVKSKSDATAETLMQGLGMIAQLVAQDSQAMQRGLQQIAALIAAPSEIAVDPISGRKRAQKVMN